MLDLMWPVRTCDGPANLKGTSRRYVPHIRKWIPPVVGDKVMMLVNGSIMGPSTDGAEFPQPTSLYSTYILNLAYIARSAQATPASSASNCPLPRHNG